MTDQPAPTPPDDPDAAALRPKVTRRQVVMALAAGVVAGLFIAGGSLFYNPPDLDRAPEPPSEGLTNALDSIDRALVDAGAPSGPSPDREWAREVDTTPDTTPETAEEPPATAESPQ